MEAHHARPAMPFGISGCLKKKEAVAITAGNVAVDRAAYYGVGVCIILV